MANKSYVYYQVILIEQNGVRCCEPMYDTISEDIAKSLKKGYMETYPQDKCIYRKRTKRSPFK